MLVYKFFPPTKFEPLEPIEKSDSQILEAAEETIASDDVTSLTESSNKDKLETTEECDKSVEEQKEENSPTREDEACFSEESRERVTMSSADQDVSSSSSCSHCGSFQLHWKHSFSDPLFAIDSLDLIGDGLEELIVLTQSGVHVLQHDPNVATQLCIERLKMAVQQQQVPPRGVPVMEECVTETS